MVQIPSSDWPRRITPLLGSEDLLKQNPLSDVAPQEERVPVSLISNFVIGQMDFVSVGSGLPVLEGKFGSQVKIRSLSAKTSRIAISLLNSTIQIDADPTQIAHSISLSDLGDVTDTPTSGYYLQYTGANWVTTPVIDQIRLTDGTNTQIVDATHKTITFVGINNIQASVSATNVVSLGWTANIADLADIGSPSGANQALSWSGSAFVWADFATIAGGSVTDGSNIGSLGVGVFASKLSSILRFRNVAPGSSKITTTLSTNNILVDAVPLAIAAQIHLGDLLDVSASSPSNGDILLYNNSTSKWTSVPGSSAQISLQIYDQNSLFNTFNSATALRIFGGTNILTDWYNTTNLRINWAANIGELSDVSIGSPSNGYGLLYNGSSGFWEDTDIKFTLTGNNGVQTVRNGETLRLLGQNGINVQVISPDTALIILNAGIADLNDITPPTAADQTLLWNGTSFIWAPSTLGEANTASNVGTQGYGVYYQKVGVNLQFRNVATLSSKLSVTIDSNHNILFDAVPLQIANAINLQDLLDVTNSPSTDGYLKYNGISWVTDVISTNFSFQINADSGTNINVLDGSIYILGGDNHYINTYNVVSGGTKETKVTLDIAQVADGINLEDLHNMFGTPSLNDVVIYDGTKFVFQQVSGATSSDGWSLGGNTTISQYAFGTISNFDIPIIANNTQVGIIKTSGKFGWGVANPTSTLESSGSIGIGDVVTKSSNYTATANDFMILGDASSGNITITIPAATGCTRREYVVKKIDSAVHSVIMNSSSLIDGSNTFTITSQYTAIRIKSNGTQWFIY